MVALLGELRDRSKHAGVDEHEVGGVNVVGPPLDPIRSFGSCHLS